MLFKKTKPPVNTLAKYTIETEIQSLVDLLGVTHLQRWTTRLPYDPQINVKAARNKLTVEELKERIASIFEVAASTVSIEYGSDEDWSFQTAIARDENGVVCQIRQDLLDDRIRVATHLANCFAASIVFDLRNQNNISADEPWPTEEMLLAWYGFGPMIAESAIRSSTFVVGGSDHWQISRLGTMTATEAGYAMAVLLYLKSSQLPDWANDLTIDAKDALTKGLNYLNKTGDCLVNPQSSSRKWDSRAIQQSVASKFPGSRLAALLYLPAGEILDEQELAWTLHATNDKDQYVRQHAFSLLQYAESNPSVINIVSQGLHDRDVTVQAESIKAAGIHADEIKDLGQQLNRILDHGDSKLAVTVATSLAAGDLADKDSISLILSRIKTSMVKGNGDASSLMVVLEHLVDDPRQTLLEFLDQDEDLRADAELLFPKNETS